MKKARTQQAEHSVASTGSQSTQAIPQKERRPARALRELSHKLVDGPSGKVPYGDIRMTANIRSDLHVKLKIVAAERRTTIGELIEELIDQHL